MSTVLAEACWNTEPALWLAMDLLHWLWLFMTLKISLRILTSWKWTTLRKQCATCSNTPRFSSCPHLARLPGNICRGGRLLQGCRRLSVLCSWSKCLWETSLTLSISISPFSIASWCGILHKNHGKFHFIIVKSLLT